MGVKSKVTIMMMKTMMMRTDIINEALNAENLACALVLITDAT